MTKREREIAWAGGLFEGEGCIYRTNQNLLTLQLVMSDEDTVRRFAALWPTIGNIYAVAPRYAHYKPIWRWCVTGWIKCQAVLATLWPGLGQRRQEKAREVLALGLEHERRQLYKTKSYKEFGKPRNRLTSKEFNQYQRNRYAERCVRLATVEDV